MNLSDNSVYRLKVSPDKKVLDISDTLYGIFFEDINRCADGGIYAEMVQNRSFECFGFNTYNPESGEDGKSGGRNHTPLRYWYGDLDKAEAHCDGGLEEYFGIDKVGDGLYYIKVESGAELSNRGFGGEKEECGMSFTAGAVYNFSIYAKADNAGIFVTLADSEGNPVSDTEAIFVSGDKWAKYTATLTANKDCIGQLKLIFDGSTAVDMVSLFPADVWGSDGGAGSKNYLCNPNYRLRRDLMQVLYDMKPSFMRFPGGCISEGSFTWENVYDWKDSVGDAAIRLENFNVWGYNMTMGLGYMEYFQMAEDLGAEPLPVMACGILCQARSDYVNPAGGALREKYIKNFTDLVDFAVSTDFEGNKWAAVRRDMGHPEPFGLHYLGIGNENWGDEFFADFEAFYREIKEYIDKNYPEQGIKIISTVGAQADDDAMKRGWSFICGGRNYGESCRFTDGEKSWEETVTPYLYHKQYLETIADEHYYRNNQYLLENADRYNYYQRGSYTGAPAEVARDGLTPQVFVGEYASTDKNTLRGAVCEAAAMTGFERNGDIVKMAATAPLFNQPMDDGTFRWTPDCIWFDKKNVYRTPTYFVQQLFMQNTGDRLLETREFADGDEYIAGGGYALAGSFGSVKLIKAVVEDKNGVVATMDFTGESDVAAILEKCGLKASDIEKLSTDGTGLIINAGTDTECVYCEDELYGVKVSLTAEKLCDTAMIGVGAGLHFTEAGVNLTKYCVGDDFHGTGLKVIKNGVEGYTLGDFSSSVYAGNLRNYYLEKLPTEREITAVIDFGCSESDSLSAYYTVDGSERAGELYCRLSSHPDRIYSSATADDEYIYIKLVNAYDSERKAAVELTGAADTAELTVLTAAADLTDTENVNFGGERVTPVTTEITSVIKGIFESILSPQSVNILKVRIAD